MLRKKIAVVAAAALLPMTLLNPPAAIAQYGGGVPPACEPRAELTDDQEWWLIFALEEERVARDLYTLFASLYEPRGRGRTPSISIFSNIAESEQRHYDAVGDLFDTYCLPDPSWRLPAGEYALPEVQAKYDAWEEQGTTSLQDAVDVGVDLEGFDIETLTTLIAMFEGYDDIVTVFTNLREGSYSHLDAFNQVDVIVPTPPTSVAAVGACAKRWKTIQVASTADRNGDGRVCTKKQRKGTSTVKDNSRPLR